MPQRKRLNQRKRYSSPDMNFHMPRVTKGLEACWPLRKSGAALFASDGGSGLTAVNTPTFSWQGAHFTAASTQYLRRAEANWRSADSAGTIMAWIKLDSVGTGQAILSSADEGTDNYYLLFNASSTKKIIVQQKNNDTPDIVSGDTILVADRWYHAALTSNGSVYSIYLDGVAEDLSVDSGANSGDWLGDVINRDNVNVGALRRTGVAVIFDGSIRDCRYCSRALSAGEIKACMHPTT